MSDGGPPESLRGVSDAVRVERDSAVFTVLLSRPELRHELSDNAARDAAARFDAQRHCDDYIHWYESIVGSAARVQLMDGWECSS